MKAAEDLERHRLHLLHYFEDLHLRIGDAKSLAAAACTSVGRRDKVSASGLPQPLPAVELRTCPCSLQQGVELAGVMGTHPAEGDRVLWRVAACAFGGRLLCQLHAPVALHLAPCALRSCAPLVCLRCCSSCT